jgi:hypothetical protein
MHPKEMTLPRIIGRLIVNEDFGSHHVDITMFFNNVGRKQGGAKWAAVRTHPTDGSCQSPA